ncbi:hypothetical protein QQS21_000400 [Conoideocrella luteorostrata]|uniref:Cytochrome P450 n=1 Tax=Conoideocrella luteorostrata TaxID=1105319 RepID=A0AAJ0CYV6_9HYPO|nr:hypothetical protein QQS21_000400 [Conoideocrella luteorostrata]
MGRTSLLKALAGSIMEHPFAVSAFSLFLYFFALGIFRLFFHPLVRYPGPRIAALTVWYEFYYDAIQRGRYTFEIKRMHEQYGPIVRISPNELHVNSPSFIDDLYAGGGKKRDKYGYFCSQFGIPDSVFGTPGHDLHRLRRGALNQFFSKASVTKLEPIIHTAIEKLISQLRLHAGTGEPVSMNMAFSCMTTDIVTEYAFSKSYNFLDSPTFEPNFHRAIVAGSDMGPWIKQFPFLITLMNSLPESVVMRLNPEAAVYVKFQEDIRRQIREAQRKIERGEEQKGQNKTIFQELLTGSLPDQEKKLERLWQEGQIVVGAGTETTAWTLSVALFYVLNNARVFANLQKELVGNIADVEKRCRWSELEQLPYLSAVICEGLRLSYGVSTRLQRINPDAPFRFVSQVESRGVTKRTEYTIPQGTPVGMTATLVHIDPDLFPEPYVFRPERWLSENGERHHHLDKYLLSFSRGSRQCIGIK